MDQPQQVVAPAPYGTPQFVMMPIAQRNGLGVFGFFVALIGLVIPTGIIALLGLVLSLAAIGRSPRGFATTGVVLGLLGTIFWLLFMAVAVVAGLIAVVGVAVFTAGAFVLTQPEAIEITSDMVNTAMAVDEYERENDALPAGISALSLGVATTIDPWGHPYRFVIDEDEDPGFDLISGGPDGELDTMDDIRLSRLDDFWEETLEGMEERMNDLGRRLEHAQDMHYHYHGSGHDHHAAVRVVEPVKILTEAERYESRARQEILAVDAGRVDAGSDMPEDEHEIDSPDS